ncbi:low temperature requirement protein A [Micromonospora carbonacea]|uniref:low temperature requirement protein A n=1 Tax=Micromonospora carbonacea TaxID=47853 RepID=UPI003718AA2A
MAAGAQRPRRWWRRASAPGWVSGLQLASAGTTRATFLELFFDLVYVFALTRVSARAFEDLAVEAGGTGGWSPFTGTGKTLLLLLALWSVWQGTAWTTSRYDPYHFGSQAVVVTALVASMVMGVAIPRAFTVSGLAFAAAYVVAQVSRPLLLLVALGRHEYRPLKLRMLITYLFLGVFWLAGAFLPTPPGSCCGRRRWPASTSPSATSSSSWSRWARRSWWPGWRTAVTPRVWRARPPSARPS